MSAATSGVALEWSPDIAALIRATVDAPSRSRGMFYPRFEIFVALLKIEGAGKTGCSPHPRSRVLLRIARDAHEHTGSAETLRPSLRNGFTAYFVLFPENGSFASVAREKLSLLPDLTPAPRRPNHTTSPYASATLVGHGICVHRISPRVCDDGQRPSSAARQAELCD